MRDSVLCTPYGVRIVNVHTPYIASWKEKVKKLVERFALCHTTARDDWYRYAARIALNEHF